MKKERLESWIEWGLILLGLVSLAWLLADKPILGDGVDRFKSLSALLSGEELSSQAVNWGNRAKFSLIGPIFSAPLWLLGDLAKSPEYWCMAFNLLVLCFGVLAFSFVLKDALPAKVTRGFLLLMIYASMFPHHVQNYYGEVFSAILIGVGIASIRLGNWKRWGIAAAALGIANAPASALGYALVTLRQFLERWKISTVIPLALGCTLIFLESYLRSGSILPSGYEGNHGMATQLPFSGLPGFSYPFLL